MKTACIPQLRQTHTFFASTFFDKDKNDRYECSTCHKRFNRPSALKTHNFTHSGEKPYACNVPGCKKRFSVISNLRRHSKVHDRPPSMQRVRLPSNVRDGLLQVLMDGINQSAILESPSNQTAMECQSQERRPPISRLSVQWLVNQDDSPGPNQTITR